MRKKLSGLYFPQLDPSAVLQMRAVLAEFDSLVVVGRLDREIAAEHFLGLGKRAVRHAKIAVRSAKVPTALVAQFGAAG